MQHLILIVVIVIIVMALFCKSDAHMEGMQTIQHKVLGHNPRLYYPDISKQIEKDKFIPLPEHLETPWAKNKSEYGEVDYLDDGWMGNAGLNFNMCSKACCSQQYPPPFSVTPDDFVLMSGKEFVPSSYTCNNGWQDSGCLCMTKEQALFLNRRGNNAYNEI